MNERTDKILIVGYYIKPNRKNPNKGVIYNQQGISPCVTNYSRGGNLVPTIIVNNNDKNTKST